LHARLLPFERDAPADGILAARTAGAPRAAPADAAAAPLPTPPPQQQSPGALGMGGAGAGAGAPAAPHLVLQTERCYASLTDRPLEAVEARPAPPSY